ncbi:3'-5' exonuclease [Streptomyces sp. N2-109]|uniref:3'-5' exonuclease n=1 Tax=Streptomyces gossypii TaxID=2883101 RepID=A0ABT2JL38_9ACTN|nr:3'-5' exonuclease [Streptomyces gossypii]MCT2588598.1 3'-5' exonuclease [Streptomyces gossypii]
MGLWYEGPLAAFATVTTGVDTERDRIASAALLVQPGTDRPPHVRRWHVGPGVPGPVIEELARALADHAEAGIPLVVMNAPFGLTLLDRELTRHRDVTLTGCLRRSSLCVLDPLVLARHLDRDLEGRLTPDVLCARYGVPAGERAGGVDGTVPAAADAAAALTALLLVRALGRHFAPRLSRYSAAELHALQAVWYAARARGLSSWCAPVASGHPVHPAWPLRSRLRRGG